MSSMVVELSFVITFMVDKPLLLGTCYLFVFCTRNCEYHSWVYFLNFLQILECHSYLYTRESNHFLIPSLHVQPQSNKGNHAKLWTLNFMFSCTVTFVLLNLSSACGKSLWNLLAQICFPSPLPSLLQLLNLKVSENIFACLPPPYVVKSGLIIFEIQILQILS